MSAQTCVRCGEIRPATAFPTYTHGICRECRNLKNQDWKKTNPHGVDAAAMKRLGDPIEFSRSTCRHVGQYLEKAKESFEKQTGTEAPPFIDAILSVTQKVLAEHPVRNRCTICGVPIPRRSTTGLCRTHRSEQRSREKEVRLRALRGFEEPVAIAKITAYVDEHGRTPKVSDIFPDIKPRWVNWPRLLTEAGYPRRRYITTDGLRDNDAAIVRLYSQEYGYKAIAGELGLTRDYVRDRLRGPLWHLLPPCRRPVTSTRGGSP